jgi:hypothetical protein
MFIDQDIKIIGKIDQELFQPALRLIETIDWSDYKFNRYEETLVEGRLCTLPYSIRNEEQKKYSKDQERLIESVLPIIDQVIKYFPGLVKIRGEIVNLLPNKQLTLHKDIYWFHKHSRRIHIPLCTNSKCKQIFEDREYHLEVGSVYEINNRIMHSACNRGTSNRVHIILDLMTKEKGKEALTTPGLATSIDHET